MCSAVSVFRAGAPLQSPPRWFYTKMAAPPCSLQLSRSTSSLSQTFSPVSRLVASCRVKSSQLREAAITPRNNGYSFHRLLSSPMLTRAAEGARSPSTIARATASTGPTSSPVCHAGSLSASLALTFPLLSAVPASRRFFASNTPTSAHPPSTPPASSQQLPVQPGEEQGSHEVEERHGDELKNFYHMPSEHHGDPRHHINPDGTLKFQTTAESFHWENDAAATPAQQIVSVNGKKMIKGVETRDFVELFQIHQKNIPFWPRMRLSTWGDHDLLMKAEFLFFWVPTFIIWSLAVPMFTMLYMTDEAIYASMTVKVIGRQWYWIYEVESPVDEED